MQGKKNKATIKLSHLVSNEVVSSFQQDGVVFLNDVFGPWVEGVRQAIEQNKANLSLRERTYLPQMGSETEFFQDYCV